MMNIIKKIKDYFTIRKLGKEEQFNDVLKSKIDECYQIFFYLDFEHNHIDPLTRISISFQTYFLSIEQYILAIQNYIDTIVNNEQIKRVDIPIDLVNCNLHIFLLSPDLHYLNSKNELTRLRTLVMEFCQKMNCTTGLELNVTVNYNRRLCFPIIKNLIEIGYQLKPHFNPLSI